MQWPMAIYMLTGALFAAQALLCLWQLRWVRRLPTAEAIRVAEDEGADHVTLMPGTVVGSVGTRSWHLMFLVTILGWISGVNRDRPRAHLGIGAFNLVRASVYRQFGGYEALKLTVLDDV